MDTNGILIELLCKIVRGFMVARYHVGKYCVPTSLGAFSVRIFIGTSRATYVSPFDARIFGGSWFPIPEL